MSVIDDYEAFDDSPSFREQSIEELWNKVTLKEELERAFHDQSGLVRFLLNRAREDAKNSIALLVQADLFSAEGLVKARGFQADAKRYLSLLDWIMEVIAKGNEADHELERRPEYQEAIYGERRQQPPDA